MTRKRPRTFEAGIKKEKEVKMMKKFGKKLNSTHETLKAYCGCACDVGCKVKCVCSPDGVVTSALYNTSVANVYSNSGSSLK
jgi:putative bacteriocin precursor